MSLKVGGGHASKANKWHRYRLCGTFLVLERKFWVKTWKCLTQVYRTLQKSNIIHPQNVSEPDTRYWGQLTHHYWAFFFRNDYFWNISLANIGRGEVYPFLSCFQRPFSVMQPQIVSYSSHPIRKVIGEGNMKRTQKEIFWEIKMNKNKK